MARPRVKRETFIFTLIFFTAGTFLFVLFKTSVLQYSQWVTAAQAQSTTATVQQGQRGSILASDKDGNLYTLAASVWEYNVLISPREVPDKQKLVSALAGVIPGLDTSQVFNAINNNNVYVPPIATGLDEGTAKKVENANLTGVFVTPTLTRQYPNGSTIAPQVLGFVGSDGVGKYGVEATHNNDLAGQTGVEDTKVDSLGRLIGVLSSTQPQAGKNVVLTLDYNLEYEITNQLQLAITKYKADSGSAIVMDPNTGAILADVGIPNFDPNNVSSVTGSLLDPNASDTYEPGSVVKPITMAIALSTGAVQPNTTHDAGGSITLDGATIHNALDNNFGNETLSDMIQNSDNVQMSWISTLIPGNDQYNYLKKFGFGSLTGVDLVGEQAGILPPIDQWNALLRATAAFGQGISTTTLNLADDYSVFANGGKTVTPHLVDYTVDQNGNKTYTTEPAGTQIITPTVASEINQMLINTVNIGEGKAAGVPGMQVAGKTGTAQVPDGQGGYSATQEIGTFAGYFPAQDPKFVMIVRLDDPKTVNFAESSAAPTFGAIAAWMTNYYGLK